MLREIILGSVLTLTTVAYGQDAKKIDLPKEVKVLEVMEDRVKLLALEIENIDLKKKATYDAVLAKLQEQPEWKRLEADQTEANRKLGAEFQVALRAAKVPEADWNKYRFNRETLSLTLIEDPKKP